MILFNKDIVDDQVICEMCHKLQKRIFKQSRKQRQDKVPAKDKAPLAAYGAEKLRATVIAQRLHCKDLEAKVKDLQSHIEKHGVSVSESLDHYEQTEPGGNTPYAVLLGTANAFNAINKNGT